MISVVYCTRKANRGHYDHIRKSSGMANQIEVIEIINEGESLTKAYNRGLKQATNDIVVFCHDDIFFNKNGWARKILKHYENSDFGILGIAGTTNLDESGRWWTDHTKMVGQVKHSHGGKTWESKYSGNFTDRIIQTLTVDGLFFAVHKGRLKKKKFDEGVEGFHFYEIDFIFDNHLAGTKVGVVFDVKVTHKSIGQTNDEWEANRLKFADKFKDKLPSKVDVKPFLDEKVINLKNKPRVKVIVSGDGSNDKLLAIHKNLAESGYDNYDISVISDEEDMPSYEALKLDKTTIHEGAFDNLHKSLSVLKWDEDFINSESELVLFLDDRATIETDILNKFVSVYNKDKKFGCIFPRILNSDNTILATGLVVNVMANGEKSHINYNLKGMNSYYSYQEGVNLEPLGNLGFCFMTTYANLTAQGWFRLDFGELFYETDFAAKCNLAGKNIYVDSSSVVKLDSNYLSEEENVNQLNEDFKTLATCFNENPAAGKFMKIVQAPKQPEATPAT